MFATKASQPVTLSSPSVVTAASLWATLTDAFACLRVPVAMVSTSAANLAVARTDGAADMWAKTTFPYWYAG
ncbi:MAG: hypothetical protein HY329_14000 [Chloroflexi bacterium]|nr:hypothetical protein [Chloroflexota bacterium]